jgi:2-phosphoglycerate kinase
MPLPRSSTGSSSKRPARSIVFVREGDFGLPYSKGLMANAIAASGLAPLRAFRVAGIIEERLLSDRRGSVTTKELRALALEVLNEEEGPERAQSYERWQIATHLGRPLVILLGGGTGAGKSTIATQLAARLGIPRVLSTDAIREVLKGVFSQEFQPTLYRSSFDAGLAVQHRLGEDESAVLVGFREQVAAITPGIEAMIRRAVKEGTDQIIEGAHVVPGTIDFSEFSSEAVIVQLVIVVADEDLHRSHFHVRAHDTRNRPAERYLAHFENIRIIQSHIRSRAESLGIPVISHETMDAGLTAVIEYVIDAAVRAATA